jgi:hydroxymethylbilane synthase
MALSKQLKIGTRKSKLAMIQARMVQEALSKAWPELTIELVPIVTTGDRFSDVAVEMIDGKGIFLKELEEALLSGEIDCAVHSMKDVPTVILPELSIGAILQREDARDALVAEFSFAELPRAAVIGTGSSRRRCQLLLQRPDLDIRPVRGNIDTRIRKWREGQFDGLVLALAGLKRAGMENLVKEILPVETMLPAAGQGALGIEIRSDDAALLKRIMFLDDPATRAAVTAERAFLEAAGGGCSLPIGVYGEAQGDELHLSGRIVDEKINTAVGGTESGRMAEAGDIGRRLAIKIIQGNRQQA